MWKLCSAVCLLFVTVQAGQNSIFSDFTITPSNQVAFYHYPAPPKSQQFQPEAQHLATSSEYQQQPYASIPKPTIPPQQRSFSQSYQNQYQYNNIVPQQQQQQQQHYQEQQQHYQANVRPQYQNYYQSQSAPATTHQSAVITQKFNSPALDSAAFTMALTNQGYTVGNAPAASTNSALSALTASLTQPSQTSSSSQLSSFPSSSQSSSSSSSSSSKSLNVKLPLPFGATPLNIANLPLQAGAPFAALPTGVNSYGTLYPQRKRR